MQKQSISIGVKDQRDLTNIGGVGDDDYDEDEDFKGTSADYDKMCLDQLNGNHDDDVALRKGNAAALQDLVGDYDDNDDGLEDDDQSALAGEGDGEDLMIDEEELQQTDNDDTASKQGEIDGDRTTKSEAINRIIP